MTLCLRVTPWIDDEFFCLRRVLTATTSFSSPSLHSLTSPSTLYCSWDLFWSTLPAPSTWSFLLFSSPSVEALATSFLWMKSWLVTISKSLSELSSWYVTRPSRQNFWLWWPRWCQWWSGWWLEWRPGPSRPPGKQRCCLQVCNQADWQPASDQSIGNQCNWPGPNHGNHIAMNDMENNNGGNDMTIGNATDLVPN